MAVPLAALRAASFGIWSAFPILISRVPNGKVFDVPYLNGELQWDEWIEELRRE